MPTPLKWTYSDLLRSAGDRASVRSLSLAELDVVFQPIVDLATGQVFAYEALARCSREEFPSPIALFERAEEERFCGRLGRMIREVCFSRFPAGTLFVNLHPHELGERWLVRPDDPMCFHDGAVYLEITEAAALEHMDVTRQMLLELKGRMNARLVVDDFGVGHSDLFRVLELEPDVVKLDRSLVSDVDKDPLKAAHLEYVIDLCTELGALVVAEGIETVEELRTVRACGAPLGQGYLMGRPSFPAAAPAWDDRWLAYVTRRSRRPCSMNAGS
ncbi:MAG: EAL domain-containing protein [Myxococcales bacterium]|nr:EAL domain-containing protein [Myxococcales bacterium]